MNQIARVAVGWSLAALVVIGLGSCGGPSQKRAGGGMIEVIIIDHPTVTSVQDRVRGFEQELAKYPDLKIVARPAGEGKRTKAQDVMESMLGAHPNVRAVFGINDDSALGALAAIQQAGRKDIVVVGYDATTEARDAILKGTPLKADVIQYPKDIGRITIETVAKHLRGEEVLPQIPVPVGIVDAKMLRAKGMADEHPTKCQPGALLNKTVGVTLLTRGHQFYRDLEGAMRKAAAREGLTLSVQSAEMNVATQTSQVDDFISRRVDAMVICPADSDAIAGAVKEANKAKIPVFTADIRANGGKVVCHIASDNVQGGREAARYLAKLLVKGKP